MHARQSRMLSLATMLALILLPRRTEPMACLGTDATTLDKLRRLAVAGSIAAAMVGSTLGVATANGRPEDPDYLGEWMSAQAQTGTLSITIKQRVVDDGLGEGVRDLPSTTPEP
jgi:hypothetical protein